MGEETDQFVWVDITICKPITNDSTSPPIFNIVKESSADISEADFDKLEKLIKSTLEEISIDNLPSIFQVHRVLNEIENALEALHKVCP